MSNNATKSTYRPTMISPHVLIAGAGPVGLVGALVLARAGIAVTVFERSTEFPQDLRASTFHPPTLDLLESFGITQPLIAQGLIARTTQQRDRKEGLVAEFDMGLLAGDTRHPFRLQCEQWKLSGLLLERLAGFPHASVHLGAAVESVSQDAACVQASVKLGSETRVFRGDYLIGADGAWSSVRQSLGIEFEGYTYPERFLVLSTAFEFAHHFPRLSYVNYVSDPQEWCVLLRVPALWRVLFPTAIHESDEQVMADASIQGRLQNLLPRDSPYQTVHRTLYKVHQRVARQFRRGRVILAGDAAHINNPLGGLGLNFGIHDAMELSDLLGRVMRNEAAPDILDLYDKFRRPLNVEYVQQQTIANKKRLEEKDPEARAKSNAALRATAADPEKHRAYLLRASLIESIRKRQAENV